MIVIATTMAGFSVDDPDTCLAWLYNAESMREFAGSEPVEFFAALEVDGRGLQPFIDSGVIARFEEVGVAYWTYDLDDGRTEVTTNNRLRHITVGQNLTVDYAVSNHADWLMFLAADMCPAADSIPRFLEMQWPLCAGEVTTYCLSGPKVDSYTEFPVEMHMGTAAYLWIHSDVFRRIRFRWDFEHGSDDPCYHRDARELLGIEMYVRKDLVGLHYPEAIGDISTRGHDMKIYR